MARQAGGTGDADGVGASEETQYLSAFYFAMVTITTVGYGDLLPATEMEREFVMVSIMFGIFLYAYIIGTSQLWTAQSQACTALKPAYVQNLNGAAVPGQATSRPSWPT